MYETKDSHFNIYDTPALVIVGLVIILLLALFFFLGRKRKNR